MQIDGAKWPLPLQYFLCVFGLGFSFHDTPILCWFCDYELNFGILGMVLQGLNLGLQFGIGLKKIKVYTLTD